MRNGLLIKILVPMAVLLGALVFYQDVYLKNAGKLSDLKDSESLSAKSLEKYRKLASETPTLDKKLAAMRAGRDLRQEDFFEGQSLSITAASLQDAVKKIIAAGGGTVTSEKTGKAELLNKFTVISAGFEITLPDTNALTNILYQLETHKPSIVVKEMYVRVTDVRKPKALSATLTVDALTSGPGNGAGAESGGRGL